MNDRAIECIHAWIRKADNDLKNAELVLAARTLLDWRFEIMGVGV